MKINWKVRFKNPVFVAQLFLSVFMPVLAYYGISAESVTTWEHLFGLFADAISNPYVVGIILVSLWNSLNDPTTRGVLSDSERARKYDRPQ